MTAWDDSSFRRNRRAFLGRSAGSLGLMALAHLLDQDRGGGRALSGEDPARGPRILCDSDVLEDHAQPRPHRPPAI